jgi:hypothetical protein
VSRGGKIKDITGQSLGRLTAIRCVGMNKHKAIWLCLCSCDGKEIEVVSGQLVGGHTKSCGCLQRATVKAANFKHGHARRGVTTPTYSTWTGMINRCTNPSQAEWYCYGGANPPVVICERWRGEHGFENFLADMGERPEGATLGRFGDLGNYEPNNCAWQTPREQAADRKKHYLLLSDGRKYAKRQAA